MAKRLLPWRAGPALLMGLLLTAMPVRAQQSPLPAPPGGERVENKFETRRQGHERQEQRPWRMGPQGQNPKQTGSNLVMRASAGLTGVWHSSTSIADVDGDGNQDLLITGEDANGNRATTLYLGDEQGGFTEANAGLTGVEWGSTSIADINGDGAKDLLITGVDENSDPSATLYLGDGQGGFTEAGAGLTGVRFSSTSIADVDGDGNQDLLITGLNSSLTSMATLYLGDGQGGFSEAGADLTGVTSGSTSIADVDGDGAKDLLITGWDETLDPLATLYLGDGQGGFSEAGTGLTGVFAGSTSIADADGDGNQDLLITGLDANDNPTTILYLGDGQGGFSEAYAGLARVSGSSSIADVDGDGNQDLLITGLDANNNRTATLYLGDGQGGFSEAGAGLTGVYSGSTSIADLQGDGDKDLLVTGYDALFGEPSARIYVNRQAQPLPNRAPTFARTPSYDRSLAPGVTLRRFVEAGDLDGDSLSIRPADSLSIGHVSVSDRGNGTAEVAFTPGRSQGGDVAQFSIEVSDSDGATGSFSTSVEVSPFVATFSAGLTGVSRSSTSIADVDGDRTKDLLITGADENFDPSATLYLGNGQGGFSEAGAGLTGVDNSSTSIADVDGDGAKDLLITGEDANGNRTATLYLGDGQGDFTEANAGLTGVEWGSTSIADVDGDGAKDLLITGQDENYHRSATLYLGDGQGDFTEANASLTGVDNSSTSIADVDGDGAKDLLITGVDENDDRTATLYLGNGQGGFSEADAGLTGVEQGSSSIADVDGDEAKDLLITGATEPVFEDDPTATLYLGDGQGGFTEAGAGLTGVRSSSTSIANVDGNGNQDLLITGADENFDPTATLYLGDKQGGFSEAGAGLAGVSGSSSIADIDGDGAKDLLTTGFSQASLSASATLYENLFDNPLPVELAGLKARADGNKVRLAWSTASETNNARFEVQRKGKGAEGGESQWATVGSVEGAGTTSEAQSYHFADTNLPYEADRLMYRLKQVDVDGSAQFSKTLVVQRGADEVELLGTSPNPARSRATVRYAVPERQDVTIRLYDMLGRQVRTLIHGTREGRQEVSADVSGLPSGTYFLRLQAEGQTRTRKLTIVR